MIFCIILCKHRAGVMELVDVVDSKSTGGDTVPVRARPPAPKYLPLFDTMVSARVGIFIEIILSLCYIDIEVSKYGRIVI